MKRQGEQCYMCDQPGPTREHFPPKCFFPEGHRTNLLTVPSCDKHNYDNAVDIEYVRDIITLAHQADMGGLQHARDRVHRTIRRDHKLAERVLAGCQPVLLNGQETGIAQTDMDALRKITEAIAYAIYFHTFGKRYERLWQCYAVGLYPTDGPLLPEIYMQFREMLILMKYLEIPMPQPEVFRCGVCNYSNNENDLVFLLRFYQGFDVYMVTELREEIATT